MPHPFLDEMRTLAAEDRLEQILPQVRGFLQSGAFSARDRDLENEGLALEARLADHQRRTRKGLSTPEQLTVERNRLRANLLDFLDEIERIASRVRLPAVLPATAITWPAGMQPEAIIGADRLKSLHWLHAGLDAAQAVGRIVGSNVGTGFLVSGGWLVTNHHVLPTPQQASSAILEMNFQEDREGRPTPPARYSLDASTFKADAALDCATVRVASGLDGAPDIATWGLLRWAPAERTPAVGDFVSIIQHPYGGRKRIAVSENQVVNLHRHFVHYQTDTERGSSGSPVLNDIWEVVAVHHAGGHRAVDDRGGHLFINEGILTCHARQALGL